MSIKTADYKIVCDDLVWINPELKEFTIPEGVKIVSLRDEASDDIKLEKIIFSNTVKKVKKYAFFNCKKLNKIVLKDLTATYDSHAFAPSDGSREIIDELTFDIQGENGFAYFLVYEDSYKEFPIPLKIKYLFKNENDILVYFFDEDEYFDYTFDVINYLNKNSLIEFEVANESNGNDISVCDALNELYKKCDCSFLVFRNIIRFLCNHSNLSYNRSGSYDEDEDHYKNDEDYYKCVKQDLLSILKNLDKKECIVETISNIFCCSYDEYYYIEANKENDFTKIIQMMKEEFDKYGVEVKKKINGLCLSGLYDMVFTDKETSIILKEFILKLKDFCNQIDLNEIKKIESKSKKRAKAISKILTNL